MKDKFFLHTYQVNNDGRLKDLDIFQESESKYIIHKTFELKKDEDGYTFLMDSTSMEDEKDLRKGIQKQLKEIIKLLEPY